MSSKYLLTCDCGQSVPVATSQAGKEVTCTCGRQLTVPSLRGIRQLPAAAEKPGTKRTLAASTWNPVKGAMFAIGVLLVLGGLLAAAYSYSVYSQAVLFKPSIEEFDASLKTIEAMSPTEVLETWHFLKEHGLEDAGSSPFAMANNVAQEKLQTCYAGLIVAAVGLLLATVPLFMRGK